MIVNHGIHRHFSPLFSGNTFFVFFPRTYPLKIDGWKMEFPFKSFPFFRGKTRSFFFGGVGDMFSKYHRFFVLFGQLESFLGCPDRDEQNDKMSSLDDQCLPTK